MANPVIITIPASVWVPVLTSVEKFAVYPTEIGKINHLWTYREAGGAAPVNGVLSDSIPIPDWGIRRDFSGLPVDIYVAVAGAEAGEVRADESTEQIIQPPPENFAGAVAYTKTPAAPYELIDVVVVFDVVPVASELIIIYTLRGGVKIIEARYNPSLSSVLQHMFRFEKPLGQVTFGVDYPNSNTNSIDIYSTYQLGV